jgi:hypothetical protein
MNEWTKKVLVICLSLILLAANVSPTIAQATQSENNLSPRSVPAKPAHTQIMEWQSREVIQVKFVEGSTYRLRNGDITTLRSDPLNRMQAVFQDHPVKQIERLFTLPEDEIQVGRLEAQTLASEQMPDLNLWYQFTVGEGTDPEALIDALNALPEVEIASPALLPAPLPTEFNGSTHASGISASPLASPNYLSQQGYLNAATDGINAKYAWAIPGGTGNKVTIVDIEYSFNKNHEDLPSIPVIGGQQWNGYGNDHGTAVLGELRSKSNSYGVKGIAYAATVKFSPACMNNSTCNYNPANAINTAKVNTAYGDVILIEQQTSVCGLSDYGPLEWDQAVYDAIKLATAAGRIVVEAAGNGNVNLDGAGCNNKFNRSVRDSGAIIVGAGSPPTFSQTDRSRLSFSSYGSRVDVQGWGYNVTTTGYGDLYVGIGQNQWYTASFSGTSSASPIVAGAAALLSSIAQERGVKKSPDWIRSTLVETGSPQQDDISFPVTENIGPRPDLKLAIIKLSPDFNSQFNNNAAGWGVVKGTWGIVNSSYYKTTGILNKWSSIVHKYDYTTLDYQVKMKRKGCMTCANGIIIRGTTNPLKVDYDWNEGYAFLYANSGYISVWEFSPGGWSSLLGWTAIAEINTNGWNTLRVTADESSLRFYVNGIQLWTGSDSTLQAGRVGVLTYRENDSDTTAESFLVNWATLSKTVPPSAPEAPIEIGVPNTDWTDYRMSPP